MDNEILANAKAFRDDLGPRFTTNLAAVSGHGGNILDESYARLTVLHAWRVFVLEETLSSDALGFYSEAQNDGLTSSVLMSAGMWRPAMKSLRSMIENILHCLYFNDHPVEYRLWDAGKYRLTFKDLFDYFSAHPDISSLPENIKGVPELKTHYRYLSNVVHSSAREFRMTSEVESLKLWNITADGVGKWNTMHKKVLRDSNLLILALLAVHLKGAARKGLREALSIAIPTTRDSAIKASLGVKIIR
ncbi:hypothetical protein [Paracoccus sp. AS002]|uniref:hypothetical protein n=1 Tax=Paracoccus sp. AS002 TaxID=3019545 RepID=UPI0023E88264|nr:hypothetical protein [Paracoccus sp. AS002]MDF3907769.1 hypothetical protein [Paracoccus sp. AS002]